MLEFSFLYGKALDFFIVAGTNGRTGYPYNQSEVGNHRYHISISIPLLYGTM